MVTDEYRMESYDKDLILLRVCKLLTLGLSGIMLKFNCCSNFWVVGLEAVMFIGCWLFLVLETVRVVDQKYDLIIDNL